MPRGYDGSIKIDTRIDEKGFNKGVKNLGGQIKEMGMSMAVGVARMVSGFTKAVGIVSLVVFAVTRLVKSISAAVNRVINMGNRTQALKQDFADLKVAVSNAFLPLLSVALPLLQQVAQWLTKIFNIIGMIIGALMGQKTVMQATATATSSAAGGAGKLAKNTKEAEKAAKGALAAFDEINVLQQEEPPQEDFGGGGGAGGIGESVEVPILQGILDLVQKIKDFLEPLKEPLQNLWDSLVGLWDATKKAFEPWVEWMEESGVAEFIRDTFIDIINRLSERIQDLTNWIGENEAAWRIIVIVLAAVAVALLLILFPALAIKLVILGIIAVILILIAYWPELKEQAIGAWENIKEAWGKVKDWFIEKVWQPLKNWAIKTWNSIKEFIADAWEKIKEVWSVVKTWFTEKVWDPIKAKAIEIWDGIKDKVTEVWDGIKEIWGIASEWFTEKVTDPIKDAFETALDWIEEKWETVWTGIDDFVRGILNSILGAVGGVITGFVDGINGLIGGANKIAGFLGIGEIPLLVAPSVPQLAQGAIIPPNSQFLAVLGDQRSGRNIETPEALMRQIVREELEGLQGGQEVTINFAGSLGALVRELKPYIDKENVRVGQSMVQGVVR